MQVPISVTRAARALGVHPQTIRGHIKAGHFRFIRTHGGHLRVYLPILPVLGDQP